MLPDTCVSFYETFQLPLVKSLANLTLSLSLSALEFRLTLRAEISLAIRFAQFIITFVGIVIKFRQIR